MSTVTLRPAHCGLAAAVTVLAVVAAGCAESRQLKATPENAAELLASAKEGDVIVLAPGNYAKLRIPKRVFAKPLVIEAGAATIEGLSGRDVDGVEVRGGNFRIPPPITSPKSGEIIYDFGIRFDHSKNVRLIGITMLGPAAFPGALPDAHGQGTGVMLNQSQEVEVADSRFAGLKNGVALSSVSGFRLMRNTFDRQRSDGITIGVAQSGLIEGNECRGTAMRGKEHPDCIQLFSRSTSPPTADVVIRKNRATGATQGIAFTNHVRNGVNDGGFDRILIEENDISVSFPNGIALIEGRDSVVRNNRVETAEGSQYRTVISIHGSGQVVRCGNVVKGWGDRRAEKDPPCS